MGLARWVGLGSFVVHVDPAYCVGVYTGVCPWMYCNNIICVVGCFIFAHTMMQCVVCVCAYADVAIHVSFNNGIISCRLLKPRILHSSTAGDN